MSPLARKLMTAFALLGLGASSAATWVHYHLIVNPDYSSFCDVNATISCKQAYLSRYGSVAGVPVALGGVIFFAWVLLMLWASRGKSRRSRLGGPVPQRQSAPTRKDADSCQTAPLSSPIRSRSSRTG